MASCNGSDLIRPEKNSFVRKSPPPISLVRDHEILHVEVAFAAFGVL
jgi:hypothetical protein